MEMDLSQYRLNRAGTSLKQVYVRLFVDMKRLFHRNTHPPTQFPLLPCRPGLIDSLVGLLGLGLGDEGLSDGEG